MYNSYRYWYLRMKDNFFDDPKIMVIEQMRDGHLYVLILLKIYLKSLKDEGRLMVSEMIPYNAEMLASVVRQPVGVVKTAMEIFEKLGLVDVLDNGAIFMSEIQSYIGKSTTEADRIRAYRTKIDEEKSMQRRIGTGKRDAL